LLVSAVWIVCYRFQETGFVKIFWWKMANFSYPIARTQRKATSRRLHDVEYLAQLRISNFYANDLSGAIYGKQCMLTILCAFYCTFFIG